jgi:hypothetical protein
MQSRTCLMRMNSRAIRCPDASSALLHQAAAQPASMACNWQRRDSMDKDIIEGNHEQLCGRIPKAYGLSRDPMEHDLSRPG